MLFYVDPEKCNRDGICVEACGFKLIERKEADSVPTLIAGSEALCVRCGHCVAVCPTGALSQSFMGPQDCIEMKGEIPINLEQAEQFLRSRRSIRSYTGEPVERHKLKELIEVSGYAPSARNARPVRFLVIEDKSEVRGLSGLVADWLRATIEKAPALARKSYFGRVVALWDGGRDPICHNAPHLLIAHADENARLAEVDCVLALDYVGLIAVPLGLGTTWAGFVMAAMTSYPPVMEAVNLPKGHKCFGVMMVGYPKLKFMRMPLRNPPPTAWR
jgi:nitroreductase/NAD-dependent dihydropyrimidine dehydrogenase PreA subunit